MAGHRQLTARERRSEERIGIAIDATIRARRVAPLPASMLDISSGGVMLRADNTTLGIGDEVLLAAGPIEAVATVAWTREPVFGLSFHRRLTGWQIEHVRGINKA